METFSRTLIVVLGACLVAFGGTAASAAIVVYVDEDVTTNDAWRTTDSAKPLDLDGDDTYGSDGYLLAIETGADVSPAYATVSLHGDVDGAEFPSGHQSDIDDPASTGPQLVVAWQSRKPFQFLGD